MAVKPRTSGSKPISIACDFSTELGTLKPRGSDYRIWFKDAITGRTVYSFRKPITRVLDGSNSVDFSTFFCGHDGVFFAVNLVSGIPLVAGPDAATVNTQLLAIDGLSRSETGVSGSSFANVYDADYPFNLYMRRQVKANTRSEKVANIAGGFVDSYFYQVGAYENRGDDLGFGTVALTITVNGGSGLPRPAKMDFQPQSGLPLGVNGSHVIATHQPLGDINLDRDAADVNWSADSLYSLQPVPTDAAHIAKPLSGKIVSCKWAISQLEVSNSQWSECLLRYVGTGGASYYKIGQSSNTFLDGFSPPPPLASRSVPFPFISFSGPSGPYTSYNPTTSITITSVQLNGVEKISELFENSQQIAQDSGVLTDVYIAATLEWWSLPVADLGDRLLLDSQGCLYVPEFTGRDTGYNSALIELTATDIPIIEAGAEYILSHMYNISANLIMDDWILDVVPFSTWTADFFGVTLGYDGNPGGHSIVVATNYALGITRVWTLAASGGGASTVTGHTDYTFTFP